MAGTDTLRRRGTQQEEELCRERAEARRNFAWAWELNQRLDISKGRWPKGKGKQQRGASEHALVARSWRQMSTKD